MRDPAGDVWFDGLVELAPVRTYANCSFLEGECSVVICQSSFPLSWRLLDGQSSVHDALGQPACRFGPKRL
jgi:hypothetical protein